MASPCACCDSTADSVPGRGAAPATPGVSFTRLLRAPGAQCPRLGSLSPRWQCQLPSLRPLCSGFDSIWSRDPGGETENEDQLSLNLHGNQLTVTLAKKTWLTYEPQKRFWTIMPFCESCLRHFFIQNHSLEFRTYIM